MPAAPVEPTLNVRDAAPADAEAIRRVHRASIEGLGSGAYDDEQVRAWAAGCDSADYASAVDSESLAFVVAEEDGELVGFGSLSFDPAGEYDGAVDAEVTAVYVHPSVARNGVGTNVLEVLERRARSRGARALALTSSLSAVPFYEHHGYGQLRAFAHEFSSHLDTDVEGDVVVMEKELE